MTIKVWHGSGTNFNTVDVNKGRVPVNDYYGGKGFYVTTDQKVAIGYSLAGRNSASRSRYCSPIRSRFNGIRMTDERGKRNVADHLFCENHRDESNVFSPALV